LYRFVEPLADLAQRLGGVPRVIEKVLAVAQVARVTAIVRGVRESVAGVDEKSQPAHDVLVAAVRRLRNGERGNALAVLSENDRVMLAQRPRLERGVRGAARVRLGQEGCQVPREFLVRLDSGMEDRRGISEVLDEFTPTGARRRCSGQFDTPGGGSPTARPIILVLIERP